LIKIAIIGKRTAKIDQLEPNVDKLAQKLSKVELPEQGSTETEISCTSQNDENKPVNQSTSEISYTSQNDENKPVNQSTSETNVIQESNIQETEETDSDDGEWITPENISKKRSSNDKTVNVACTTTDFAMQNVILQMNLNLISLSHKIKRQQKWVMRCHACYQ
jgi:RNA-binding protein NOB1